MNAQQPKWNKNKTVETNVTQQLSASSLSCLFFFGGAGEMQTSGSRRSTSNSRLPTLTVSMLTSHHLLACPLAARIGAFVALSLHEER